MMVKDVFLYKVSRPIITVLFKIIFRPKIINKHLIPKQGRVILAGNHTSNLDCLLLISSTKRNIHFLAKKELWHGLKRVIFANMGLIPVDRKNKDHQALELAIECLQKDLCVGIFPEGTTEKKGQLLPFKMGCVKMANVTDALVVPFVIKGKYGLFKKRVMIKFLAPIRIGESLENENKRLRSLIELERGR